MAREPTPKEKEKIAAGPRYDPGKPVKRWRPEPEPKAPTLEPVIPQPPPKPPPPTLEPVIPQPYIEPKDAKVVSTDAKGNPAVLQTPDGKKHYTPFQTTMWGLLGFATEDEYLKSQRTGEASQYVGITKGVDKPVRVSRAELAKASRLKGEKQFEAFKEIGAIPFGSKFLPGPGGYQGKDWIWIDPDTIKKFKGQIIARLARASVKKPRVVIPAEMRVDIGKRPTVTPTGVPGGPPLPKELITHPSYLKLRPSVRGLISDPAAVVRDLKKEPTLENIQEIIDEWKKAQSWWQKYEKDWKPSARLKASLAEFSGKEQIGYFDRLEAFNDKVTPYNIQIEAMNKIGADFEKEGAALQGEKVEKYNDELVRLNALALSWERQAAGINLESEAAVRLHNKKLDNINKGYQALLGQEAGIEAAIGEINAFNKKIDIFNTRLTAIVDPGEAPEPPPKTIGNIGRALFDSIVMEYEKAAKTKGTLKQKVDNVALLTAELIPPGVWVASPYFGTKMEDRSWQNILLNIGLDLLIIVPVARAATLLLKRALGATAKGAVRQAVAAELKVLKQSIKAMRMTYGKQAAQSLKKVAQLQGDYLKQLAKLERLKAAGKPITSQSRATILAETKLSEASRDFITTIRNAQTRLGKKGKVGVGFDSPEIAEAFFRMPAELVRHTKGVLQAITKAKPKKIKQLQADVVTAEATLKAAQAKWPLDPSRWTDLVGELLQRQAMLTQGKAGSLAAMQQELIRVQQELYRLKAKLSAPALVKKLTRKQRQELKIRELNLERQRLDLAERLRAGLRTMELEWGRGGFMFGGSRVLTAVRPRTMPTSLTGSGAAVTAPTTATMTAERVAARTAIAAEVVKVIGTTIPEVVEIVKGLTTIEIVKAVEAETIKAIRAAEKLAAKPAEQTKLDTKLKLEVAISAQTRAALETAAKAAPKAAVARALKLKTAVIIKAATKVGLKVRVPIKPLPLKPIPVVPIIPKIVPSKKADEKKRKRIREAGGAVCWRQGQLNDRDIWRVVIAPYTQLENWFYVVGKKPSGATLVTGPRSAYQTIKLLRGKPPTRKVTADMGAMDVSLEPKGAKVGIGFKPDPKLQTRSDIQLGKNGLPPIRERIPPITERRTGLGGGKSTRITPRTPRLRR